jgi:hypothetical protein
MYTSEEINQLNHEDLLELLWGYDMYVEEVSCRDDGSKPVCLKEYFNNDFGEETPDVDFTCSESAKDIV